MGKLSVADHAKQCLEDAIAYIAEHRTEYVHNPASDFTRERKLNMEDTMSLILSMDGGSLAKELYEHFTISNIQITPSGFVQQRSKLKSEAFYDLMRRFNHSEIVRNKYKGYRILAVDSSAINQPRDPELDSFMNTSTFPHGLNQTQMSALYDVLNKTVLDVDLRPRPKMNEQAAMIEMLKRRMTSAAKASSLWTAATRAIIYLHTSLKKEMLIFFVELEAIMEVCGLSKIFL